MLGAVSFRLHLVLSILIVLMIIQAALSLFEEIVRVAQAQPVLELYGARAIPAAEPSPMASPH